MCVGWLLWPTCCVAGFVKLLICGSVCCGCWLFDLALLRDSVCACLRVGYCCLQFDKILFGFVIV